MAAAKSTCLQVPSDVRAELDPLVRRLSRGGVEVPFSRVAIAAMKRGAAIIAAELDAPSSEPPGAAA